MLPESITAVAYHASNGELAWARSDIPAALSAIAASGHAVLGGEVWVASGEGQWIGLVPNSDGGPPGIWHWSTTDRGVGEGWPEYCERAAEESVRIVANMRVAEESTPEIRDRLFFNITYVKENEI